MSLASASIALVSTATAMTSSRPTGSGDSRGSSPWSRESSMTCWTRWVSRSLSVSIRLANRCTASGSSAASCTASASSLIAPTGVFSSWLTLATKSRRTASTRRSRVRSSTRARTRREPSGATRALTLRGGPDVRVTISSASRIWPSRRTSWTRVLSSSETRLVPRTKPMANAGADALTHDVVVVDDHRTAAQHREHGGDAGGHQRLLRGRLPVLLAIREVPREHRAARHEGTEQPGEERLRRRIHTSMVRRAHARSFESRTPGFATVHRPFTREPPVGQLVVLALGHARCLPRPARLDLRRSRRHLPARRRPRSGSPPPP